MNLGQALLVSIPGSHKIDVERVHSPWPPGPRTGAGEASRTPHVIVHAAAPVQLIDPLTTPPASPPRKRVGLYGRIADAVIAALKERPGENRLADLIAATGADKPSMAPALTAMIKGGELTRSGIRGKYRYAIAGRLA